jgi:hypothetical protein
MLTDLAVRGSWMTEILEAGDTIFITCRGKSVEGRLESIVCNKRGAVLVFTPGELLISEYPGYEGRILVLLCEDGVYRSVLDGTPIAFKKKKVLH